MSPLGGSGTWELGKLGSAIHLFDLRLGGHLGCGKNQVA
jgi:hypothetical protein